MTLAFAAEDDIDLVENPAQRAPIFQVTFPENRLNPQQLSALIAKIASRNGIHNVWTLDDRHLFVRHDSMSAAYQVVLKALVGIARFKSYLREPNLLHIMLVD